MVNEGMRIDALLPPAMAERAENIGVAKAQLDFTSTLALAVLAGAFIALGAEFATLVGTEAGLGFGATRLLMGLVFSLGLILVIVAGAELFTGNNLIIMAWASGKVSSPRLLRNWALVYAGNFLGAIATATIIYMSKQWAFDNYKVGATGLNIAHAKVNLGFVEAVALGALCNVLVCLAVWLCYSARSTSDKILSIVFPITAFVASGFEHSVANMYFIPMGLFLKGEDQVLAAAGKTTADLADLTWLDFFLHNLVPVTIGNIIGGAVMVGLVYWFVYLRPRGRLGQLS